MTNPITNYQRPASNDVQLRKSAEKQASKAGAPTAGLPPPSEVEVAASKSVAASAGAEVAGFAKVRERIKQEPDFDRSKVDSIKKAIQDGQYPLNPRRIAESFVAMEQMISG